MRKKCEGSGNDVLGSAHQFHTTKFQLRSMPNGLLYATPADYLVVNAGCASLKPHSHSRVPGIQGQNRDVKRFCLTIASCEVRDIIHVIAKSRV